MMSAGPVTISPGPSAVTIHDRQRLVRPERSRGARHGLRAPLDFARDERTLSGSRALPDRLDDRRLDHHRRLRRHEAEALQMRRLERLPHVRAETGTSSAVSLPS